MRALCTTTIAAALAALVAACGGGGTKTVTVTTSAGGAPPATPTATLSGPVATPTTTIGTTTTPPATTTSTAPATPTTVVHLHSFRSPSGNIGCELYAGSARCDIRHREWSPPPKPATCQLDYGQGLIVYGSNRGQLVCAGDTALDPTASVLAYGSASLVSGIECVSATTGMTCTDRQTGHGFWIAIQGYRAF